EESIRRVHATQDMVLYRPIKPPEQLAVSTTLALMERRKPGAYVVTRYDIIDTAGLPVATVNWGRIFRHVEINGPDRLAAEIPAPPQPARGDGRGRGTSTIPIPANA